MPLTDTADPRSTTPPAADAVASRPEPAADTPGSFLPRALAFAALLTFIYLWTSHHLGWKTPLSPGWVGVVLGAALPSWKLIERALTKAEKEQVGDRARHAFRGVLRPAWVLVVLALVTAVVAVTVSSVLVIPESGAARGGVAVHPLDGPARGDPVEIDGRPALRFTVLTTPFGRMHTVRADGYIPTPVVVFPLVGARVRLGRDVPPSPSLLLRPSVAGLGFLEDGGHVRVRRVRGDTAEIAHGGEGHRGSLALGRTGNVPGEMVTDWERQLVAAGATPVIVARTLSEWRQVQPLRLDGDASLAPGDIIIAEILTPAPRVVARGEVTLGTERLVHLFLEDIRTH
jgi:hypothetical protein